MKKHWLTLTILLLLATLLLGCAPGQTGQTENLSTNDLMANIQPTEPKETLLEKAPLDVILTSTSVQSHINDFSVKLFQSSLDKQQNTLVSPLSVLLALAMTANGAEEETLAQMEATFGCSLDYLNFYLQAYAENLPQTEKAKLSIANSIWLKTDEDIVVRQDFLQTNADYYNAGVYQTPFDAQTLKQINKWVKTHTDGMIDKILDEIPRDTVMYLINALAFDAEWENPYREHQVWLDIFTKEGGGQRKVNFMYSTEPVYLQDENTSGFIKYYAGRDYAFVGLLPATGTRLEDYVAGLSGEKLYQLLENAEYQDVDVSIPKFAVDYDLQMNDVLQRMGMLDAFDLALADFSNMAACADGRNIFINEVLHKTHIEVDEHGTKAAAVTAVGPECGGMPPDNPEVYLNRPFVYLLIDCREQLPLFIGTVRSIE